jgi:4-amino-4-deoxy-L-arabinose transferase-like glycosyltransferase
MTFSQRIKKIDVDYVMYGILILFFLFMLFLSSFRDMIKDESLYFHETYLISELFKQGKWIGDYGVGLHGFLFKLPPALIFLVTGPSIQVVTVFNILLATLVGFVFYKFSKEILKHKHYALLSTLILLTSFHFFSSTPTYLREIPALLIVLLFMYSLIKDWKKEYVSIVLLLLLDAKEYIFLGIALFYLIWLFVETNEKGLKRILYVIKTSLIVFLPSLFWMILMFYTGVIPVNMFLASIIGLIDRNFAYLTSSFSIDTSTLNLLEGGREIPLIVIKESWSLIFKVLVTIINIFLMYIGKILYPRTFSFISIPKFVIFPVVFTSILFVKEYVKSKKESIKKYALLSLLFLTWLIIYLLRASHGRYLLPVVPAISIIFVYILFKYKYSPKQLKTMLLGTSLFVLLGFFFETSYVLIKTFLELLLFGLFSFVLVKNERGYLPYILVTTFSVITIAVSILFAYTQGQIYGYLTWGKNRQVEQMAEQLPLNQTYWINNDYNQYLVSVYMEETYLPAQWKWGLYEILPKKERVKELEEKLSYVFPVVDISTFRENISLYDIQKVVLVRSDIEKERFPDQQYLGEFLKQDWLVLEKEVNFKNRTIYIFNVTK